MFACSWPCLPLPHSDGQDAVEVAPAPVLEPLVAPQSACVECGAALPAKTGPGRRSTRCDACKPKRNGHDPKPLPDLTERPMRGQDYEKDWLADQLAPPKLPWET